MFIPLPKIEEVNDRHEKNGIVANLFFLLPSYLPPSLPPFPSFSYTHKLQYFWFSKPVYLKNDSN